MLKLRLYDFYTYDDGNKTFTIQIFGKTPSKESVCLYVQDFRPHFFIKYETEQSYNSVFHAIENALNPYDFENMNHEIVERKTLEKFDNGKLHRFIFLEFQNMSAFRRVTDLWYLKSADKTKKTLNPHGFHSTFLYESNIPPLLRFFHIDKISPTGWIEIDPQHLFLYTDHRKTWCDIEFFVRREHIIPLPDCNDLAPFKICSMDIEADSSHGDFPVPIKTYKKLAMQLVDQHPSLIADCIRQAFGFAPSTNIDLVYPKVPVSRQQVEDGLKTLFSLPINHNIKAAENRSIESYFEIQHQQHYQQEQEQDHVDNDGADDNEEAIHQNDTNARVPKKSYHKFSLSISGKNISALFEDTTLTRDAKVIQITELLGQCFPPLKGDSVTFIGSTFKIYGQKDPYFNHCVVLGTCEDPHKPNTEIVCCKTEREVLVEWTKLIQRENPDIIIGYNIFGFDYSFMFYRAKETSCLEDFLMLSKNKDERCCQNFRGEIALDETTTTLASGQYELKYIRMSGRLQIDLYNVYRREENLPSYKLDYVSGHFIGDAILDIQDGTKIFTKNFTGLFIENYVLIGASKYQVMKICDSYFVVDRAIQEEKFSRWALAKDDVTPQDIFRMTKESDHSRYLIAKYCLQDCNLLHHLMDKTDILTGYIEMATICSVPISFLVLRGQGIKLTSYVAKKCREMNTLMKVLGEPDMNDEGYEGATVLDPKCNLYLDNPVACVDYASLYPSSMISENLSHDSKVWTKEYDLEGNLLHDPPDESFDNLPGIHYVNITYDTYKYVRKSSTSKADKVRSGYKVCRFAQFPNAIMPSILKELVGARKTTRQLIKTVGDEFMKNVLDKRQLGYKVTANSLYGQCGAKTSTFYDKDIAASTTRTGRSLLIYAKTVIETVYHNCVCELTSGESVVTNAEYIYGDTDSVFFTFNLTDVVTGEPIRGKRALEITIELAQEAGEIASKFLKYPHDLEYEKTFMPFCLLSKKRYVGMLYELDANKCKRKEMGIVLKRRDNAPIVKDIYGGIIDILMKQQDILAAVAFLRSSLQEIIKEQCPMSKLIISKSLRSDYKNPSQIAHKVLADRIAERDPGNKPNPGDRIPYVYIVANDSAKLQGDKIETPTFILENKLKIDYGFYITNQIMKPVQQLFSLVLEDIFRLTKKHAKLRMFLQKVGKLKGDVKALEKLRNEEVKILLFDPFLTEATLKKEANQSIKSFFSVV